MKPVYCNTINVTHNKARSETVLTFVHVHAEHSFSVGSGGLTDVTAQVADEEASILLNRASVMALKKLLDRVTADWDAEPNAD